MNSRKNMLKILKKASSNYKPTNVKKDILFNFKPDRTGKILNGLSVLNKVRIGKWLDTIEVKDVDGEPYIASPFGGSIFIYKDVSYSFLYHWCAVNFDKTRLAKLPKPLDIIIYNLITELCIDIYKTILCMRETKITYAMIYKVEFNMYLLKYYNKIFNRVPYEYFHTYIENHQEGRVILKEYLLFVLTKHRESIPEIYYAIYDSIIFYMGDEDYMEDVKPASGVFETLLSIYKTILKLYIDNKKNAYKPIKEPYNIDKGIEPHIPLNQQLPRELQLYKIRLNHLQKASNESELKEFEEANTSNEKKLKELDAERMKKYVFKKDVYDRIYEGKYSPKQRKELLSLNAYKRLKKDEPLLDISNRRAKSYGSIGKIHNEYSGNLKAFTTISDKKNNKRGNNGISNGSINSSSNKEGESYYVNDIDPYTREEFSEMTPKKQKYASFIIYNDGKKEHHYRFDTISIYNYILKCIDTCEKPINFFNRVELTDTDLNEICKKIKHFTKALTYNSSKEIRPLLVDCSKHYDNPLRFQWVEDAKPEDLEKEIIGSINIYIAIKLGNIEFKIFKEEVLKLPIFNANLKVENILVENISYNIVKLLKVKLSEGAFISRRFFPYRKNKPILNLPKFPFELDDDAVKTLERLKIYKDKIELL